MKKDILITIAFVVINALVLVWFNWQGGEPDSLVAPAEDAKSVGTCVFVVSWQVVERDKAGRWRDLPSLEPSATLRKELAEKMPGYRLFLYLQEWFKHGTCITGATPEIYFHVSLLMLDALNVGDLAELFRQSTNRDIASAVDRSFGKGAEKRMEMDCLQVAGNRLIGQLEFSFCFQVHWCHAPAPAAWWARSDKNSFS